MDIQSSETKARMLSAEGKHELRCDMAVSSAWAKAELKRLRVAKSKKC